MLLQCLILGAIIKISSNITSSSNFTRNSSSNISSSISKEDEEEVESSGYVCLHQLGTWNILCMRVMLALISRLQLGDCIRAVGELHQQPQQQEAGLVTADALADAIAPSFAPG